MTVDVGVGELVDELEQRGDRLPFEIGAFVALEACEGLLQQAVKLEPDDVRVTAEGSVVVAPSAERAEPHEAARSLLSVLSRLLVAAGPGVPPHLLELVRESVTGEAQRDLRHLHDAIEASLIPINRGASRRVLARLVRESDRPPAHEGTAIDPQQLDAELDELLRDPVSRSLEPELGSVPLTDEEEPIPAKIEVPRAMVEAGAESGSWVVPEASEPSRLPTPAVGAASPAQALAASQPHEEAVTATVRVRFPKAEPNSAQMPIGGRVPSSSRKPESPTGHSDIALEPASAAAVESATTTTQLWATPPPVEGLEGPRESAPQGPDGRESSTGREATVPASRASVPQPLKQRRSLGPWLLLGLGTAIGVYVLVTTGVLDRLSRSPSATAPEAPPQSGTIEVTVAPADAQVLLFVGRGPTVIEGLSVAGPHEFVVLDRGLEPSRAVVPKGANWSTTDDGAVYELAVQARPLDGSGESVGLGAPLTTSFPSGEPRGNVRVITNPPGAKVYRLVGLGPRVEMSTPSIHEGQEILVYHPQHSERRAVIGPSDWRLAPGQADHRASLEVALPPLPSAPLPSAGIPDSPEN